MNNHLVLYYTPFCPFCSKVRNYLKQKKCVVVEKDTSADSNARKELLSMGGKTQVPCLMIDGKALYESNDIIQWFEKNEV